MRQLLARARRAAASLLHPRILLVQEDVCWCGIHHLGDYVHVHEPVSRANLGPITGVWWVPEVADPTAPTVAELDAGIRLNTPTTDTTSKES